MKNPWPPDHKGHWWSGWPGAWCMRCGVEDAMENAIGEGWYDPFTNQWDTEEHRIEVEKANGRCAADGKSSQ